MMVVTSGSALITSSLKCCSNGVSADCDAAFVWCGGNDDDDDDDDDDVDDAR